MIPFYQVKGIFFRSVADENNLIIIDEVFKNDSPIIAREKAFIFYQNYIDVFLESKGKSYISHEETIRELQDFLNSYQQPLKMKDWKLETDFDKGMAIYLIESPKTYTTVEGEVIYEDKRLIHYIDKKTIIEHEDLLLANLRYEHNLYCKNDFDCNQYINHFYEE